MVILDTLKPCWISVSQIHSKARTNFISGCLMAFCLKILGGGGDLQIIILLKNECSFSGGDM